MTKSSRDFMDSMDVDVRSHKRVRVVEEDARSASVWSDDESEEESEAVVLNGSHKVMTPKKAREKTHFSTENGGERPSKKRPRSDDSESDEEERDEEEDSDWFKKDTTAGWIDKIVLEHFMCHHHLTLDFCRHINFINGSNGSGKSAILAALQVCLGARASKTHRAHRISDLVRETHTGKTSVQIHLWNEGPDSFEPCVWGKRIIVEKSWTKKNSSTITILRDARGVARLKGSKATKKLEEILDELKICVDNPVCVLDQENAKKFICGKDKEKYKFFLKATEISKIDKKISLVEKDASIVLAEAKKQEAQIESYKQSWQLEKRKLEELERLENLQNEIQTLRGIKPFVTLVRAQAAINKALSAYEDQAKLVQATEKICHTVESEFRVKYVTRGKEGQQPNTTDQSNDDDYLTNGLRSELDLAEERLEQLRIETKACAVSRTDLAKRTHEAKTNLQKLKRELTRAETKVKLIEKEYSKVDKELKRVRRDNEKKKLQANNTISNAALDQAKKAVELAQTECTNIRNEAHEAETIANQAQRDLTQIKKNEREAKLTAQRTESELRVREDEIVSLKKQLSGGPVACFGDYQQQLQASVLRRASEFHVTPIGPLGSYLQLKRDNPGAPADKKNTRWIPALEAALSSSRLQCWLVADAHDKALMYRIASQLRIERHVQIVIQPWRQGQRHSGIRDLTKIHAGYIKETVASVLQIDNDWAFNACVDMLAIDTIALCETRQEAEQGPIEAKRGGQYEARRYVSKVHLLNGDETGARNGSLYYKTSRAISHNGSQSGALSMALDGSRTGKDRIQSAEESLPHLRQMKETAAREYARMQTLVVKADLKVKSARAKSREIGGRGKQTDTALINAQIARDALAAQAQAQEKDTELEDEDSLIDELQRQNDELDEAKRDCDQAKEVVNTFDRDYMKKLKAEDSATAKRNNDLRTELEKSERALEALLEQQEIKKAELEKCKEKAKKSREKLEQMALLKDAEYAREAALSARADETLRALNIDERPDAETISRYKTEDAVDAAIIAKKKLRNEAKNSRILDETNIDAMRSRVQNAHTAYQQRSAGSMKCFEDGKSLARDAAARRLKLFHMQKKICKNTNKEFDKVMNTRGSSGALLFDHDKEHLGLIYQADSMDDSNRITSIANLSGGERSFTTLAMLLAIGHSIESPFRIMDEFDVFMDQVSRKIAMQELIDMAQRMSDKQYGYYACS